MYESLLKLAEKVFRDKELLTIEEIAQFLQCDPEVVYNWTRRIDSKRRPPKLSIGKLIRFPKDDFMKWLAEETARRDTRAELAP